LSPAAKRRAAATPRWYRLISGVDDDDDEDDDDDDDDVHSPFVSIPALPPMAISLAMTMMNMDNKCCIRSQERRR